MPKGSKGEKRHGDVIRAAVMVGRIVRGEIKEETTDDGQAKAAQSLGARAVRAKKLSPDCRAEIAREAAKLRWATNHTPQN